MKNCSITLFKKIKDYIQNKKENKIIPKSTNYPNHSIDYENESPYRNHPEIYEKYFDK